VDSEATRGLGDVPAAVRQDALDVLPLRPGERGGVDALLLRRVRAREGGEDLDLAHERTAGAAGLVELSRSDAVAGGKAGKIVAHLEQAGFVLRAARLARLTEAQAGTFYEVHRGRPFYDELVRFMTSGPCLPMALERDDAVAHLRTVIGATDPDEAAAGTIRKLYAESKGRNAIHASDSQENADREVRFFFPEGELAGLWS